LNPVARPTRARRSTRPTAAAVRRVKIFLARFIRMIAARDGGASRAPAFFPVNLVLETFYVEGGITLHAARSDRPRMRAAAPSLTQTTSP